MQHVGVARPDVRLEHQRRTWGVGGDSLGGPLDDLHHLVPLAFDGGEHRRRLVGQTGLADDPDGFGNGIADRRVAPRWGDREGNQHACQPIETVSEAVGSGPQIGHQGRVRLVALGTVRGTQHRRRMRGRDHPLRSIVDLGVDQPAAVLGEAEVVAQQGLRGHRAQAHDQLRAYGDDLCAEPGPARLDVAHLGRLVDPALTALLEPEVLDGVRHVHRRPVDAGLVHRLLQQSAGRTDERDALAVLDVAGLLSHQHHPCLWAAAGEDSLGCWAVQLAALAVHRRLSQSLDVGVLGYPLLCTHQDNPYPDAGHSDRSADWGR